MDNDLLEQARGLSVEARIDLVEAIWDTVHHDQGAVPLSAAQIALLGQRVAAYDAEPSAGASWEEVRARLERLS